MFINLGSCETTKNCTQSRLSGWVKPLLRHVEASGVIICLQACMSVYCDPVRSKDVLGWIREWTGGLQGHCQSHFRQWPL